MNDLIFYSYDNYTNQYKDLNKNFLDNKENINFSNLRYLEDSSKNSTENTTDYGPILSFCKFNF